MKAKERHALPNMSAVVSPVRLPVRAISYLIRGSTCQEDCSTDQVLHTIAVGARPDATAKIKINSILAELWSSGSIPRRPRVIRIEPRSLGSLPSGG